MLKTHKFSILKIVMEFKKNNKQGSSVIRCIPASEITSHKTWSRWLCSPLHRSYNGTSYKTSCYKLLHIRTGLIRGQGIAPHSSCCARTWGDESLSWKFNFFRGKLITNCQNYTVYTSWLVIDRNVIKNIILKFITKLKEYKFTYQHKIELSCAIAWYKTLYISRW